MIWIYSIKDIECREECIIFCDVLKKQIMKFLVAILLIVLIAGTNTLWKKVSGNLEEIFCFIDCPFSNCDELLPILIL